MTKEEFETRVKFLLLPLNEPFVLVCKERKDEHIFKGNINGLQFTKSYIQGPEYKHHPNGLVVCTKPGTRINGRWEHIDTEDFSYTTNAHCYIRFSNPFIPDGYMKNNGASSFINEFSFSSKDWDSLWTEIYKNLYDSFKNGVFFKKNYGWPEDKNYILCEKITSKTQLIDKKFYLVISDNVNEICSWNNKNQRWCGLNQDSNVFEFAKEIYELPVVKND